MIVFEGVGGRRHKGAICGARSVLLCSGIEIDGGIRGHGEYTNAVDLGRSRRLLCRVWTIEDSLCTGRHFFDFRKGNGFCLCEALPSTVPEEDGNHNCNENQGADDTTCQGALADTRG